jgi:hypothetical protein
VQQLRSRSRFLFLYLDALFEKDAFLIADFADTLVELYAEHAPAKLIDFLRASSYFSLEAVSRNSFITFLITQSHPRLGIQDLHRTRSSTGNGILTWKNG